MLVITVVMDILLFEAFCFLSTMHSIHSSKKHHLKVHIVGLGILVFFIKIFQCKHTLGIYPNKI